MSVEFTGPWSVVAARTCGFLILLPSVDGIGSISRIVLAAIIGVSFASASSLSAEISPECSLLFLEFFVGVAFAIPVVLLLDAISSTGEYVDAMRGQLIGNIQDPVSMSLQSSAAVAAKMGSLAIILSSGGAEAILQTLVKSYSIIPAGAGILTAFPVVDLPDLLVSVQSAILWPLATLILCGGICLAVELAAAGVARVTGGAYLNELQFAIKSVAVCLIVVFLLRYLDSESAVSRLVQHSLSLSAAGPHVVR